MGTNPVATWTDANNTTQSGAAYKNTIDGDFAVAKRIVDAFAPRPAAVANMTILVDAGNVPNSVTNAPSEVAQQTTATFTAPVSNPRIDRVVVSLTTGAILVVAGTPAGSPTPPNIPNGYFACAQVLLTPGMSAIAAANITDERPFGTAAGTPANVPLIVLSGAATNVAELSLDFSALWSVYSVLEIRLIAAPVTNGANMLGLYRDNSGDVTGSSYQWSSSETSSGSSSVAIGHNNADTSFTIAAGVSNGNQPFGDVALTMRCSIDTNLFLMLTDFSTVYGNGASVLRRTGGAFANSGSANKGVSFKMNTGNMSYKYRVIGYP